MIQLYQTLILSQGAMLFFLSVETCFTTYFDKECFVQTRIVTNSVIVVDKAEDVERVSQVLHSVLYTYIMRGDLGQSVDFVDSLIVQGNVSSSILDHQLPKSGPGLEKPPLMTIVYNSMKGEVWCSFGFAK